ncbi:MAG: SAM-dependent methyltransferase [Candidatus Dadabacteria bacterium]|nr:MAG: SAM-dependent methyltransferase [Candidatus Dadabacteria bacterium]
MPSQYQETPVRLSPDLAAIRCCPVCHGSLAEQTRELRCVSCDQRFAVTDRGQADLRLPAARNAVQLPDTRFSVSASLVAEARAALTERVAPAVPHNRYSGPIPTHLTREQVAHIPEARRRTLALDLGCGSGLHRPVLEGLGYTYYGLDYEGDGAMDLADAHALPCRNNSFDLALSIAVLEHLRDPTRAMQELHRVLKPGALFIGTAAFMEPFHDNSYFHFSYLGVYTVLVTAGFIVERICPIPRWNVVRAHLRMGFGGHVPDLATRAVAAAFDGAVGLHRRVASLRGRSSRDNSKAAAAARHAGAFFFVASKPNSRR